ncbi:hypothetical protein Trydic_g23814 [Trypoxylus dichotomus]
MADVDVRIRQRSVIEFFNAEGETPIRIHERLKNKYGDATEDVSSVRRWVRRCNEVEVLKKQDRAFYHTGIHALVKRRTKVLGMDGDYINAT